MAEIEVGGMTFKGGKMMVILTALSTLGGAAWGGFQFYADYMNMKDIIANIDTGEIENRNEQIEIKMEEMLVQVNQAIDYSRSIKNDLRDDFNRMEANVDRIEDSNRVVLDRVDSTNRKLENRVRVMIDRADTRFDTKRESLQTDTKLSIESLEDRLNTKIQTVLNNPLSD